MKRLFFIFFICLLPSFVYGAGTFVGSQCDPSGSCNGQGGFSRLHFISSIKQFLNPFGPGPQQGNDVSMRTYDAVKGALGIANAWTYVRPNNWGGGACLPNCLPSRDNHVSFYVPAIDEFWVTGGSHIVEAFPPNQQYFAGRLSFSIAGDTTVPCTVTVAAGCAKWLATSISYDAAFAGVIKNSMWGTAAAGNPANAWAAGSDMGMSFGGNFGGNPTPRHWIVERNLSGGVCGTGYGGSERYIMCELPNNPKDTVSVCGGNSPGGSTPGRRHQATNILTSDDTENFYLYAGWVCDIAGVHYNTGDLWRWNRSQAIKTGNGWTQLASPPTGGVGGYQPACFFDTNRNRLVCWVDDTIRAYSVATNTWSVLNTGLSNVFNQMSNAFDPRADVGMFIGGNYAVDGAGYSVTLAYYPADNFYIPNRTWVARSYSNMIPNAAGRYPIFNGGGNAGGKHQTSAVDINTGKIYFFGGDSNGPQYDKNTQGTWSYYIPTNTWIEEYPQCGLPGDIVQAQPDELGVTFDTKRNKFWTMYGFSFLLQSGPGACGTSTSWNTASPLVITGLAYYGIDSASNRFFPSQHFSVQQNIPSVGQQTLTNLGSMPSAVTLWYGFNTGAYEVIGDLTYDPVTNKYASPGVTTQDASLHSFNATYDPVTDSIWRMGPNQNSTTVLHKYDIANNVRSQYEQICLFGSVSITGDPWYNKNGCVNSVYFNNVDQHKDWITIDPVGRKLYALDQAYYRLLEADLTSAYPQWVIKAYPPSSILSASWCLGSTVYLPDLTPQLSCTDFTHPHFDTINNVLLFPSIRNHDDSRPKLGIYHPNTDTWELDGMYQPNGLVVRGNHSAFDPVNNVLMVIGGLCAGDPGVCQGGGGAGDGGVDPFLSNFFIYRYGPASDDTLPQVVITTPTTNPSYDTSVGTINLAGTASDNIGVSSVTWSNDRGGAGNATGTTSWSINNIILQNGQNKLTVVVHDAQGNVNSDILTVNFTTGDIIAPVVIINTPTTNPTYSTTQPLIDLAGTCTDNIGCSSVTWLNSAGGNGNAQLIGTNWSIFNIPLVIGINNITITGFDAVNNSSFDTIQVTRDVAPPVTSCIPRAGDGVTVKIDSAKTLRFGQC